MGSPPQDAANNSGDRRGHLRAPTSDPWDIAVTAQATWVQCFDNLSEISDKLADAFCRLSTGGAIRRRSFYSLRDETVLSARRPVLLTAVETLAVRDDLASRSLFLRAGRAPGVEMLDEVRLWREFEAAWPALLGCILDAVSVGLANQLPDMADPPRLASFANWVSRCEIGLGWAPGTFMAAYRANQIEGAEIVANANPVVTAVREFAAKQAAIGETGWAGTPTDLYKKLTVLVGTADQHNRKWPKRAAELSKKLLSSQTTLARLGVLVTIGQRSNTAARLALSWPPPQNAAAPPAASGSTNGSSPVESIKRDSASPAAGKKESGPGNGRSRVVARL